MRLNLGLIDEVDAFMSEHNLIPAMDATHLEIRRAAELRGCFTIHGHVGGYTLVSLMRFFTRRTLHIEGLTSYGDTQRFVMCGGDTFHCRDGMTPPRPTSTQASVYRTPELVTRHADLAWTDQKFESLRLDRVGRRMPVTHFASPRSYTQASIAKRALLGVRVARAVRDGIDDATAFAAGVRVLMEDANRTFPSVANTLRRIQDAMENHKGHMVVCGEVPGMTDCGHIVAMDDMRDVNLNAHGDSGTTCDECIASRRAVYVDGDLYMRNAVYYWNRDEEYHLDSEPDDDDDDYGDRDRDEDEDEERSTSVMGYSTDVMNYLSVEPSFKTTTHGDFHMGVELETMYHGRIPDSKVCAMRDLLGEDYLVAKEDGSLSGDGRGIEWVTQPTSLAVHVEKFTRLLVSAEGASARGELTAWNARCCGTHVHIDARAFTAMSLGKFIQFFDDTNNAAFIRQIAGRHPDMDAQASTYARRSSDFSGAITPSKVLKGKADTRYVMVNTENLLLAALYRLGLSSDGYPTTHYCASDPQGTVEVRIFRASLRPERHLAQLEFTHALLVYCRTASMRSLDGVSLVKWLKTNGGPYPWLCKWYSVTPKHGKVNKATALACTSTGHVTEDEAVEV